MRQKLLVVEWLLKSVIPRLPWPKLVFKDQRAITGRKNTPRLWRGNRIRSGGTMTNCFGIRARRNRTGPPCWRKTSIGRTARLAFTRKKLKGRIGPGIKPTLFRFSGETEALLKRRPRSGPLFPYLCTVRAGDRAIEFHQRCVGLGIKGVSLHSYRYALA